jgi:hypothetical protein
MGGAVELNERILAEIAEVFRDVQYGRITFFLSPDKKALEYSVETTHRVPLAAEPNALPEKSL